MSNIPLDRVYRVHKRCGRGRGATRVTATIGGDTCRVVGGGRTACCKVTVSMGEVYRIVVESRGSVLPMSRVVRKMCSVSKMSLDVPTVMNTSNVRSSVPVGLDNRRTLGLGRSTSSLGGVVRAVRLWVLRVSKRGNVRMECYVYGRYKGVIRGMGSGNMPMGT